MGIAARWRWFVAICLLSVCTLGSAEDEKTTPIDPKIIESLLKSKLELHPETETYNAWLAKDNFFEVFFFNWTNADKFPGEKPHLEEVGPFRFQEHRKHVDITWYNDEKKLGYRTLKTWVFDETSPGSLDDSITTVDYITASLVNQGGHDQSYFLKLSKNVILKQTNHGVSATKTARELLFDGYSDSVLNLTKNIIPQQTVSEKFGWFYQRNNSMDSSDGFLVVTTGSGASPPGQILQWNSDGELRDSNKYYKEQCSKLEGSLGDFFPRNLTEDSELKIFVPSVCRTVPLRYSSSGEYRGLKYHKYGLAPTSFGKAPYNTCFCNGLCEFEGVMNVSACRNNEPLFVSLPHFLHGDPRLLEQLDGLKPDAEKHSYYYAVEPRTGIPLDIAIRYQMNVYMQPDEAYQSYRDVPKMLFPVYWVQELTSSDQHSLESLLPKKTETATP